MPSINKKKKEAREKIDRLKKYGIEEGLETFCLRPMQNSKNQLTSR